MMMDALSRSHSHMSPLPVTGNKIMTASRNTVPTVRPASAASNPTRATPALRKDYER